MTRATPRRRVWCSVAVAVVAAAVSTAAAGAEASFRRASGPSPVPQAPSSCSPLAEPGRVHNYEYQPSLSVDPSNSKHVASAWVQDFQDAVVVGVSSDGGATWGEEAPGWDGSDPSTHSGFMACENGPAGLNAARNPHIAIGKDGTVYAVANLASSSGAASVVVSSLRRSGKPWRQITTLADSTPADAYSVGWTSVVADPRRSGVAYVLWDRADGNDPGALALAFTGGTEYLARTRDAGQTWTVAGGAKQPVPIGTPDPDRIWSGGTLLMLPNGSLLDVFIDCPVAPGGGCGNDTSLRLVRSADSGSTWSQPTDVVPPGPVNKVIDAAVSPDGSAVYVAWFDGWTSGALHVAASLDGGKTFMTTRVPTADPVISVNVAVASDGTVGLLYYDQRNKRDDATAMTDVWLARSKDRGATFVESHLAGPFDINAISPAGKGVGEYQGFRGSPGGFDVAITLGEGTDTNPTDVWFAHVPT